MVCWHNERTGEIEILTTDFVTQRRRESKQSLEQWYDYLKETLRSVTARDVSGVVLFFTRFATEVSSGGLSFLLRFGVASLDNDVFFIALCFAFFFIENKRKSFLFFLFKNSLFLLFDT